MAPGDTDTHHKNGQTPRRANIVLVGFLLVAGFYLFTEHRAHLFGILPFLLLLLCPLMHLFMHGRHGHGNAKGHSDPAVIAPPATGSKRAPDDGGVS
ncbi:MULTISPECIES: DUF2933 domain-containing protein [unclassified Sphingobium]|uniref:DUF2933 domain-containing protein n=1 Tax=unclassified Sphingobium TaxID=2611147 RepID=UPI0004516B44|nr:DUF2933 domain-containing protein [Sphingobium sp. Ant17]EXS68576.1 hypothetical protein BF95_08705 [Sphingobium sp. Ant17]